MIRSPFSRRPALLRAAALGGLVLGLAALPGLALAQGFANFQGAPTGPVVGSADAGKNNQKQAAPPALPGTQTRRAEPAPAAPGAGDLPPTEALFDAINRGDMLAARDAVNRGADLNGHNVLGLSPLDLSIDLARNDITFLLLSLRPVNATTAATGRTGGSGTPPAASASRGDNRRGGRASIAQGRNGTAAGASASAGYAVPADAGATPAATAAAPSPAQIRREERLARIAAAKAQKQAAGDGARTAQASPSPAPVQDTTRAGQPARQYAGDRGQAGTPIPQMGFLGFGSTTR